MTRANSLPAYSSKTKHRGSKSLVYGLFCHLDRKCITPILRPPGPARDLI